MRAADWILVGLVALALAAAVAWMVGQHRRGRYIACGGDCVNCPWARFEGIKKK
mgnify:CR=1 FL=1